jgi:hypothetical protein
VTAQYKGRGGLNAEDSADTTTIEMAGHVIVVKPKELIVDSQRLAAIDERSKSITIIGRKDRIEFEVDGKLVATLP